MITPELQIIRHSLGLDDCGSGRAYRNHFCTGPESDDFKTCEALVAEEMMSRRGPSDLSGGDFTYHVTKKGRDFEEANRPLVKKLTRSQERYRRFLNADTGWSFREFLKHDQTAPR